MAKAPRKPLSRKSKKALMSAVITVLVTVAIILDISCAYTEIQCIYI